MGYARKDCWTCHRTIVWFCPPVNNPLKYKKSCEICTKYGFPNEEQKLPIPCKTCGQHFEVKHITSPKGTFKFGKFVNCRECREKKQ